MHLQVRVMKKPCKPITPGVLIVGDGRSLLPDLEVFRDMRPGGRAHDVVFLGRSYQKFPGDIRLTSSIHWANVDANEAKWWAEHLPFEMIRHTIGEYDWMDVAWDVIDAGKLWDPAEVLWHGSSALFAVYVCLAIGWEKIVLAGCPMDSSGHWYDRTPGPRWTGESYQAWLEFARTPDAQRVESLSGFTRQILEGKSFLREVRFA